MGIMKDSGEETDLFNSRKIAARHLFQKAPVGDNGHFALLCLGGCVKFRCTAGSLCAGKPDFTGGHRSQIGDRGGGQVVRAERFGKDAAAEKRGAPEGMGLL